MARTKVRIDTKNDDIPALRAEIAKCKSTLKNRFIKLAGKSFGSYQSREIDRFITKAYEIVKFALFGEFAPPPEQLPLCVIATGSYALGEMTIKSKIDLAIFYKNIAGYNAAHAAREVESALALVGLEAACKCYELGAFAGAVLDDIETKTLFYQVRFVCGSKRLYKLIKEQIAAVRAHDKPAFIAHHLARLGRYEMMRTMSLRPNLRDGYGGFYDYKRIFWLINMIDENTPRTHAFRFINEKENSEINLAVDYISSLRSALQLCGGESELGAEFLPQMTKIMQTKEKKQLGARTLLLGKALASMHTIALYSRFLAAVIFGGESYAPLDARGAFARLAGLRGGLAISELFALKRCFAGGDWGAEFGEIFALFRQVFWRDNAAFGLKALLEAGALFEFVKPLDALAFFPQDFCDVSLDELGVRIVECLDGGAGGANSNLDGNYIEIAGNSIEIGENSTQIGENYIEMSENSTQIAPTPAQQKAREIWREFSDDERALLRLCGLFVPLGDAQFGGSAANIFRSYANKFAFSPELLALGVGVVKNHNLMCETTAEDFYDQAILLNFISYFTAQKTDEKRALKMLFVISVAALEAKNQLSHYAAKALLELYELAQNALSNTADALLDAAAKRAKKEMLLRKNRDFQALGEAAQRRILGAKSNLIFAKYDAREIVEICEWAAAQNLAVRVQNAQTLTARLIVKKGWNVVAVLEALREFDLDYMEICELFDGKFFVFLEFARGADERAQNELQSTVLSALCAPKTPPQITPKIAAYEVSLDLNHSKNCAQVKLNAPNQRGLMAYVLGVFERYDASVMSGRIQTIRGRARNLFLLEIDENLRANYAKILSDLTTA